MPTPTSQPALDELRHRLSHRLGAEFVACQDKMIRTWAKFVAKADAHPQGFIDARHRETFMQYLSEELFPAIPWMVKGGPGWEHVKDNPPKPSGWALAQVGGAQ